jgi:hypothetical protein
MKKFEHIICKQNVLLDFYHLQLFTEALPDMFIGPFLLVLTS